MSTAKTWGIVAADPDRFGKRSGSRRDGSIPSSSALARIPLVVQEDVRTALIRQWGVIADATALIDLATPSRCSGWANKEVLAHLSIQPHLVARFLRTTSAGKAALGVTENLSGTGSFSELIDASAREGAALDKVELRGPLDAVRPLVLGADLEATITTLQGSISVSDYLVTRCVEAVVHGGDLVPLCRAGSPCPGHHRQSASGYAARRNASVGVGGSRAPRRAVDRRRHGAIRGHGSPGGRPARDEVDRRAARGGVGPTLGGPNPTRGRRGWEDTYGKGQDKDEEQDKGEGG